MTKLQYLSNILCLFFLKILIIDTVLKMFENRIRQPICTIICTVLATYYNIPAKCVLRAKYCLKLSFSLTDTHTKYDYCMIPYTILSEGLICKNGLLYFSCRYQVSKIGPSIFKINNSEEEIDTRMNQPL